MKYMGTAVSYGLLASLAFGQSHSPPCRTVGMRTHASLQAVSDGGDCPGIAPGEVTIAYVWAAVAKAQTRFWGDCLLAPGSESTNFMQSQFQVYPNHPFNLAVSAATDYEYGQNNLFASAGATARPTVWNLNCPGPIPYTTVETQNEWLLSDGGSTRFGPPDCDQTICYTPSGVAAAVAVGRVCFSPVVGWLVKVDVELLGDNAGSSELMNAAIILRPQNLPPSLSRFVRRAANGTLYAPGFVFNAASQTYSTDYSVPPGGAAACYDVITVNYSDRAFDYNNDGRFNASDVGSLTALLGQAGPAGKWWDVNNNGVVDADDIAIVQSLIDGGASNGVFGDANADGVLDCSDISTLLGTLNTSIGNAGYRVTIDKNLDGTVTLSEYRDAFRLISPADVASLGGSLVPDGSRTVDDIVAFQSLFFANDPLADLCGPGGSGGPDGQITQDDYSFFLNAFFRSGC